MKAIKVVGVPEHFNLPWHIAIENGIFASKDIEVQWGDEPSGTGAMGKALHEGVADMAILLTEGAITQISQGGNFKILQWYVKSPLIWGIHTKHGANIELNTRIFDKNIAISRKGSGSHLIPMVHAHRLGVEVDDSKFVVVNNLAAAVEFLQAGKADIFYWEKYTTHPWVQNSTFDRIGEFPTPWPCFVIAVNVDYYTNNILTVRKVQEAINLTCSHMKQIQEIDDLIAHRYHMPLELVHEWLGVVQWAHDTDIAWNEVKKYAQILQNTGIISHLPNDKNLLFHV
ncbi:MAG: ABC transporter substrate-binding protein [Cytophagales bacterium]|nr:ABC transporter substrate-binding protein [Cytophagales bacterium]